MERGDAVGWFEELYAQADGDAAVISWADLAPNPNLVSWLDTHAASGQGRAALVVGCGLGDDAEDLGCRGFDTTAFDVSPTAIAWCRRRFPQSQVQYVVADLFQAPAAWEDRFGLVLEAYTLQVLPPDVRRGAMAQIAGFVAPGGVLLVITRGREPGEPEGAMPWPLTRREINCLKDHGLTEVSFDDYLDQETPPVRRFRVTCRKRCGAGAGADCRTNHAWEVLRNCAIREGEIEALRASVAWDAMEGKCVQVVFNEDLEPFYRRFPFFMLKAGLIDNDTMRIDV